MEVESIKKGFCTNYFLINPKEASFFDIICLLFSSNLKKRKFIESSFENERSFLYRLVVFFSAFLQKLLIMISMPMSLIGTTIVYLLNFLHINGGFFGFIRNIIQVNLVIPNNKSAAYQSFMGFTDTKMELDSNIKYGNPMYYPALSIMACKAVYNNAASIRALIEGQWKMEFLGKKDYWNDSQQRADTQLMMFRDKSADHDTIVVCFRGTQPFNAEDWRSVIDLSWYEFPDIGKIHSGFLKALGMQKSVGWPQQVESDSTGAPRRALLAYYDIRDTLRDLMERHPEAKFIVTGHSLGGALAILFSWILFYHDEQLLLERMEGVYTFGQPRVGDEAFGNYMEKNLNMNGIQYYRYVYSKDVVPRFPFDGMFKHFGTCCIYYDRSKYQALAKSQAHEGEESRVRAKKASSSRDVLLKMEDKVLKLEVSVGGMRESFETIKGSIEELDSAGEELKGEMQGALNATIDMLTQRNDVLEAMIVALRQEIDEIKGELVLCKAGADNGVQAVTSVQQISPEYAADENRAKLRRVTQQGTIREYVGEFNEVTRHIPDLGEKEAFMSFMDGLKPWAQQELQRRDVQDLTKAMSTAQSLIEFNLKRSYSSFEKRVIHP